MKKLTNKTLIALLGFILIFAIITSIRAFRAHHYYSKTANSNVTNISLNKDNFKQIPNLSITSSVNDSDCFLQTKLGKKNIIFYFNPEYSCNVCVDDMISLLNKISKSHSYHVTIILISKYQEIRDLKILKNKYKISFECYNSDQNLFNEVDNSITSNSQILIFSNDKIIENIFFIAPSDPIEDLLKECEKFLNG